MSARLLERHTAFTSVPSAPSGQMPCTGHPSTHVHVAQSTSFIAGALVFCAPVCASKKSSSYAPQLDCRNRLSAEKSTCVM